MRIKILTIFIIFDCLLMCINCGRKKTEEDKYGIKIVDYESRFASHVWGGVYRAMYYKGKEICHYINGYTVSPDVKYILYFNWEERPCRYEIYVTDEDRKIFFPNMEYNYCVDFIFDKYHKFDWQKDKVILSDTSFKVTLHFKQALFEKESQKHPSIKEPDLPTFYEYVILIGYQFHQKLKPGDQGRYKDKFDIFLRKYPLSYNEILGFKKIEILDNLGERLKDILSTLKNNYGTTLSYQIVKRAYDEAFMEESGKIKLKPNFKW